MSYSKQNQTCVERISIANIPRAIELIQTFLINIVSIRWTPQSSSLNKRAVLWLLFVFLSLSQLYSQTSWTQIGQKQPSDISNFNFNCGVGLVHKVMFEPDYDALASKTRVFAWGYSGLWMSPTGEGNDWVTMNTDQLTDPTFSSLAVDPDNRNHIIATTGSINSIKIHSALHPNEFKYSTGFWDGNYNGTQWVWTRKNCTFEENSTMIIESYFFRKEAHRVMTNVCFNHNNHDELLCTIVEMINPGLPTETYNSTIYKSTNGGFEWFVKTNVADFFLKDIVCVQNDVFITGLRHPNHTSLSQVLLKSEKTVTNPWGSVWTDYSSILAGTNTAYINFFSNFKYYNVCFTANTPNNIYISGFTNTSCQTLKIDFPNNNAVSLHTSVNFNLFNDNGHADVFDIDPLDATQFLYGGWDLAFVKFNGTGVVFENRYGAVFPGFDFHGDVRSVTYYPVFDPAKANAHNCLLTCDGGVFKGTYNSGTSSYTWTNISTGLEILNATDITCTQNPLADEVYVNTWDNGVYKLLSTGKWEKSGIEGHEITVKPDDYEKYYYQEFPDLDSKVKTGGSAYINSILHDKSEVVYNPQNPKQFYLIDNYAPSEGINRVTEDNSGNITETNIGMHDNDLTAIDVCATNPDVIVIAKIDRMSTTVGRCYRTTNGGGTWSVLDITFPNGLTEITDLVIGPTDPNEIWVSDFSNQIAVTHDGGVNWTIQTLPNEVTGIYSLFYLRGSNDMVFAGTSCGLFVFNANTNTWDNYNTVHSASNAYLPRSLITGIDYNYNTNTMFLSTFGRGVWKGNVSCNEIQSSVITITGDETWNFPITVNSDIFIDPGARLHITNTLRMGKGKKIHIATSGKLFVVNGAITTICPDDMWQGILVEGNIVNLQIPSLQGYAYFSNAKIENAEDGVYSTQGGIIIAKNNSIFKNCNNGIRFSANIGYGSVSRISNCSFINDKFLNIGGVLNPWESGIQLFNTDGIIIEGCYFECQLSKASTLAAAGTNPISRGIGIKIIDGSARILRAYDPNSPLMLPCSSPNGVTNLFIQLHEGIKVDNSIRMGAIDVFESEFSSCGVGIDLKKADKSRIYKNAFDMPDIYSDIRLAPNGGTEYVGIKTINTSDFILEQNEIRFKSQYINKLFIGIDIDNSTSGNPLVQSFIFSNSIKRFQINSPENELIGIRVDNNCLQTNFWCNKLEDLTIGLALIGDLDNQGGINPNIIAANNEFINFSLPGANLAVGSLFGHANFEYFFDPSNPNYVVSTNGTLRSTPSAGAPNKCGLSALPEDYYCLNGKGKIVIGDPNEGDGDPQTGELIPGTGSGIQPKISITPNPSSENITVIFSNFAKPENSAFINIVNSKGVSIQVINILNTNNEVVINISKFQKGVYSMIVVNSVGENAEVKLVKK